MNRRRLIAAVVLVVGCTAQPTNPPTQPPTTNPTALPSTSSPRASTTATATVSPLPITTPSPTPTLGAPTPTGEPQPSRGCGDEPAFSLIASGFGEVTFVTNAGNGSDLLYVVEQGGRISSLTSCQSAPSATPWLDISGRISSGGERGLLGLAFHPDFESNGRFFVDYTDVQGNSVISEFTAVDGSVDTNAERVLLNIDQPFPNHNGGMLAFGPDGYLYVGLGDGGSGGDPMGNGQSLKTELGKILRIDVDADAPALYGIPVDNPFAGGDGQNLPEIWDWGLRNPWRFSFDRESGGLFIGDVGQDMTEEIDVEPMGEGGRNYGWNVMEGDHCYGATECVQDGLTLPVATYSHDGGCSITGGYVYRGLRYPSLVGQYFYADLCSGIVWSFDADAALAGEPVTPAVFGHVDFAPSSFGEDEAGELYIVDHEGSIYSLGVS